MPRHLRITIFTLLALAGLGLASLGLSSPARAQATQVYVVQVQGEINPALVRYAERVIGLAEANGAAVLFEVDTPGGYIDAATQLKNLILATPRQTVAFVKGGAWSAGALISMAAQDLYMAPATTIGAAEPRTLDNQVADYKAFAVWAAEMQATAQARGRNEAAALAMADVEHPLPGQTMQLLVLSAQEAVELGVADGVARDRAEALSLAGLANAQIIEEPITLTEKVAGFLTSPYVAPLLLLAGLIGLGIELATPGIGVPGAIGLISLGLFFGSHIFVGTASWLDLTLLLVGTVLLVIEMFIPGFGIFGVLGLLSVALAIFFMVPDPSLGFTYLAAAAVGGTVMLFVLLRSVSRRGLGRWLTLSESTTTEEGYLPGRVSLKELIGQEGLTVTPLRPAGVAEVAGQRVDVVTEGGFLEVGTPVTVVAVDGTRVVVKPVKESKGGND